MAVVPAAAGFFEIDTEMEFDAGRGIEHPLEHRGETFFRERLELFGEVAVVTVGADGNAATDGGVEFARVAAPLLERVAFVELPVEFGADD